MASQVGSKWDYKGQIDGMKKVLDTRADTAALLLQRVMTVVRHWQHSTDVIVSLRSQALHSSALDSIASVARLPRAHRASRKHEGLCAGGIAGDRVGIAAQHNPVGHQCRAQRK